MRFGLPTGPCLIRRHHQAKHNLSLTEIALRWCQHHSALKESDGIIIGASSPAQLAQNCKESARGKLPDEVVNVLDQAYRLVQASGSVPRYWR
jgi:aflatoxin B1 aldehyde reductase